MSNVTALTFGVQAFVTLFVIMDPPGVSPIFLSIVGTRPKGEIRKLAIQAALTSLIVITTFALFGRLILNYLNISIQAMQIAGGECMWQMNYSSKKGYVTVAIGSEYVKCATLLASSLKKTQKDINHITLITNSNDVNEKY